MNKDESVNFPVSMKLPQDYFNVLSCVASEHNIEAEQYAKQIVMNFIAKNYPKGLTKR